VLQAAARLLGQLGQVPALGLLGDLPRCSPRQLVRCAPGGRARRAARPARPGECLGLLGQGSASARGVPRPRITRVRHSRTPPGTLPSEWRPASRHGPHNASAPGTRGTGNRGTRGRSARHRSTPRTGHPTPRNGSDPLCRPRDQARHNPPERRRTGGSGTHSGRAVRTPRCPSKGVRLPGGPSRVLSGVCLGSVWGAVWGPNKRLTCTVWGVWGETAQKHPPRRLSAGVCPCPSEPRREHRLTTPETMTTNNGLPNNAIMALSEW